MGEFDVSGGEAGFADGPWEVLNCICALVAATTNTKIRHANAMPVTVNIPDLVRLFVRSETAFRMYVHQATSEVTPPENSSRCLEPLERTKQ